MFSRKLGRIDSGGGGSAGGGKPRDSGGGGSVGGGKLHDSDGGGSVGGGKPRDSSNDEMYWRKLSSVIDVNKERLWDAMIEGFEKYGHVLKERAKLIKETDSLKQQVIKVLKLLNVLVAS